MKTNKFIVIISAVLIALPALAGAQSAPSTAGSISSANVIVSPPTGGSVSSASSGQTPPTGDSSSSAGSGSAPSSGDSSSSAGSGSAPSTGGSVSSAGGSVPSTGPSTSSAGPAPAPTPTPASSGGPTSSSGSSSSSSGSGGSYFNYLGTVVATAGGSNAVISGTCPLITASIMKPNGANDPGEVARLQSFLKDTEGYDADVNGAFDKKTESAVIAFQTRYLSEIMGPWGATKASGTVYITTTKKINEISCNTTLNLSTADIAIINAYKEHQAAAPGNSTAASGPVGLNAPASNAGVSLSAGPVVPASASITGLGVAANQTAAAGNTTIFDSFWNFLKGLF